VKAYTAAASGGGEIRLNQLHAECHSRINYKKTCPIHGEISNDQIVSGYEYSKGQFVIVDTDELDKLRTDDEKAINIDAFVKPGVLDQVYLSGKNYYLIPDGPVAQKPYALLCQGMVDLNKQAVGQVVMHGRDQVVLLRPMEGLLSMSILSFEGQITKPSTFESEVGKPKVEAEELKLVKTLVEASTPKEFDFAKYKDLYTEKLAQLIDKKVAGEEIVAPPVHEQAQIINLMDALRQSLAKVQGSEAAGAEAASSEAETKPPRKMAPSVRKAASGAKKRKSS
jgi:DNA end-binding protein Ku